VIYNLCLKFFTGSVARTGGRRYTYKRTSDAMRDRFPSSIHLVLYVSLARNVFCRIQIYSFSSVLVYHGFSNETTFVSAVSISCRLAFHPSTWLINSSSSAISFSIVILPCAELSCCNSHPYPSSPVPNRS